jgi:hypothetical protein
VAALVDNVATPHLTKAKVARVDKGIQCLSNKQLQWVRNKDVHSKITFNSLKAKTRWPVNLNKVVNSLNSKEHQLTHPMILTMMMYPSNRDNNQFC